MTILIFNFTLFTLHSFGLFWCYPDLNHCFQDPGKEIEIDPTKCSGNASFNEY